MSVNSFRTRKCEDFEIVDANTKVVGHIRLKPSGVLLLPFNGKDWYGWPKKIRHIHGARSQKATKVS